MLKSVLFRASLNCLVFTLANADFNCRGKSVGYYAETLDDCRTFYVCDDHGRFMTKEFKKAYEKTLDTSIKTFYQCLFFIWNSRKRGFGISSSKFSGLFWNFALPCSDRFSSTATHFRPLLRPSHGLHVTLTTLPSK